MDQQDKYIEALIKLHSGTPRQGPGDTALSMRIIEQLPALPPQPRIADIGCGSGAGALLLAKHFHAKVRAVDFSPAFLEQMMQQARQQGLADLIEPVECDMGSLHWPPASIDLLWSEGAAYNITFEGALRAWRPLLAQNGIAVISEMNYFSEAPPAVVVEYMKNAYPGIKTEQQNAELIDASGFELISHQRLPSQAWWDNYYDPLRANIEAMRDSNDEIMQTVIEDTEQEMLFFRQHDDAFGYTFYIMRAV